MGKRFGHLGAYIRGVFYYNLSHHEQRPYANWLSKSVPNVIPRTRATYKRWLPTFIFGYLLYRYLEYSHWSYSRKDPRDYVHEVEPPPPKMCRRVMEPRPTCKKDFVYEEYPCAEGEEPDEEFLAILAERKASEVAASE
ncbi:ucrQ family domain-containing protein [Phthorimaea operculella]|nr:ucrQ family domain-containing protein [Phthorimaea operculella]